nr:hypothetical protein [Sphingopyxis sp. GC21]
MRVEQVKKPAELGEGGRRFSFGLHLGDIFVGDSPEGGSACRDGLRGSVSPRDRGIDPGRKLVADVEAFRARSPQSHVRILAERQPAFVTIESVSKAPEARTIGLDQQE